MVRKTFGKWAAGQVPKFGVAEPALVPVPSKDGVLEVETYRSLDMVRDIFAGTDYAHCVVDGLRWNQEIGPAHLGGERSRAVLLPLLEAKPEVKDDHVILVDDLLTTGGSLLASMDRLTDAGAFVLGAITCGKTVYDFKTPAFGTGEFDLTAELADWPHG